MSKISILIAPALLMTGIAMAGPTISWKFASHSGGNDSALLSDDPKKVDLRYGWSCLIGKTSKALPIYEARQTTCQKGDSVFEFSVQCEASRTKDHSQVRLRDDSGKMMDYIEVACELTE